MIIQFINKVSKLIYDINILLIQSPKFSTSPSKIIYLICHVVINTYIIHKYNTYNFEKNEYYLVNDIYDFNQSFFMDPVIM